MSNYVRKVAIVGATGTVGKFITAELLKRGKHEITAITRIDSTAVIPDGVKAAKVDYNDQSSLVKALQGQDVLIITMSVLAPKETQEKLVEAAAEANVEYVLPNEWCPDMADESLGNDIFLGPVERGIRAKIETLGKSSWIAMATGFWYEYSLGLGPEQYGMDWKKRTWTFYDDGETMTNTITWPQSGRAVASLLSLPRDQLSQFKNKFVYVDSFCTNQKEMFESVLRVTGTKREDWTINYEDSVQRFEDGKKQLQSGDRLGFSKLMYSRVFWKEGSVGNFGKTRGLQNELLGLPKEDMDEFTKIAIDRAEKGIKYH